MATNYNIRPSPTSGTGAYGMVPGTIDLPPSLYQQSAGTYGGLQNLTNRIGSVITNQAEGELAPETLREIQDAAAAFGMTSGLPLTNFTNYYGLKHVGTTSREEQQKGIENYQNFLKTLGSQMTDPALAAQIASWNAVNLAAPNPSASAAEQLRNYYAALNAGAGGARRTPQGGTYTPITRSDGGYGGGTLFGPNTGTLGANIGSEYDWNMINYGFDPSEFGFDTGTGLGTNLAGTATGTSYNPLGTGIDWGSDFGTFGMEDLLGTATGTSYNPLGSGIDWGSDWESGW